MPLVAGASFSPISAREGRLLEKQPEILSESGLILFSYQQVIATKVSNASTRLPLGMQSIGSDEPPFDANRGEQIGGQTDLVLLIRDCLLRQHHPCPRFIEREDMH